MPSETGSESPLAYHQVDGGVDLLALHALDPERYPYLLQSVVSGTPQSRFDILFAFPGERLTLDTHSASAFLPRLDAAWLSAKTGSVCPSALRHLPFFGGWFLYLGYELAAEIEPSLNLPSFEWPFPIAFATRISSCVVVDHESGSSWLISEDKTHLPLIQADLGAAAGKTESTPRVGDATEDVPQAFISGVDRIRHYIREGDVFQVNLSRRWRGSLDQDISDVGLYASLCRRNPAPFAALVRHADQAIISSSPERLVSVKSGLIESRPIAGTRPRGEDQGDDAALKTELLAHPKERAEHIMLIDLERNDLGRVCIPGSVEVNELMRLESYRHVHHIVSNIRGRLRDEVTPGDVIRAVFPGGTITGCPKVRCMEIIAELEKTGRGPYTGSVGYLGHNGDMDLNILIRSIVRDGDKVLVQAGAGIVADSDADRELDETRAKWKGVLSSFKQ